VTPTTAIWLVRCGDAASPIDACVSNDVIAVRSPIGDATALTQEKIQTNLIGVSENELHRQAEELYAFVNRMAVDDIVLSPDKSRNHYLVGRITGNYRWSEDTPVPEANHLRDVQWVNSISWDDVPMEFKTIVNYQRIVRQVNDADLVSRCREAAQAQKTKGELLSKSAASTRKSSTPRARGTRSAAPAKPAKFDPTKQERLCTSCGLKKHIRQFSGDAEFCIDCE